MKQLVTKQLTRQSQCHKGSNSNSHRKISDDSNITCSAPKIVNNNPPNSLMNVRTHMDGHNDILKPARDAPSVGSNRTRYRYGAIGT